MTAQVATARATRTLGVDVVVDSVIDETSEARTFALRWPTEVSYLPGQFITVRVPSDQTGSVARSYSLSSAPGVDDLPAITVKRTLGGYGSNWLCDNISAGDSLHILAPSGVFTPTRWQQRLHLFAAGSGITPVVSILKHALAQSSCDVDLFYANKDRESVIFSDVLHGLEQRHRGRLRVTHWLESDSGLPTPESLTTHGWLADGEEAFICGPAPFMDLVESTLRARGAAHSALHVERYVSLTGDPFTLDAPSDTAAVEVQVSIDGNTTTVPADRATPLLDALLANDVDAPYSCREGDCGSCMARLVTGEVEPGDGIALEPEDIADGYILTCQARPSSDSVEIEFD